jgi:hypothetical protein
MTETSTFALPYACQTDASANPERLQQLEFHVRTGDYFPVLATVLCFLEESVKACESGTPHVTAVTAEAIQSVRNDLLYLHKHYSIERKD